MTTVQMVMITIYDDVEDVDGRKKYVILPNVKKAIDYVSDEIKKMRTHTFLDFKLSKSIGSNCIGHVYHEKDGWKLATLDFVRVEITDNNFKVQIIKES